MTFGMVNLVVGATYFALVVCGGLPVLFTCLTAMGVFVITRVPPRARCSFGVVCVDIFLGNNQVSPLSVLVWAS